AAQLPKLEHILVIPRIGEGGVAMIPGRDVGYAELSSSLTETPPVADTAADTPFMIIYTSGTTGLPDGTVHVHRGFPVKATQDLAQVRVLRQTGEPCGPGDWL